MFVHDCLPFSLANSGTFRKTVTDLDPKIKVKQGRTYSKYVRNDEQKVKKSIKSSMICKIPVLMQIPDIR